MQRISKTSFVLKWLFPIFWFGILALVTITILAAGHTHPAVLVMPLVMAVFGYFIMKKFVWDLADEVFDGGDFLLVRKGNLEQKIYLSDIVNIEHLGLSSPPRVTIMCRTPGLLGTEVAFIAPSSFNPFKKPKLVEELIERVDRTRRR